MPTLKIAMNGHTKEGFFFPSANPEIPPQKVDDIMQAALLAVSADTGTEGLTLEHFRRINAEWKYNERRYNKNGVKAPDGAPGQLKISYQLRRR